MGRYYDGDISGKFWFGTQSNYDPQNLGCSSTKVYQYKLCGCKYENKGISYCTNCYHSEEEHQKKLEEHKKMFNEKIDRSSSLIHEHPKLKWTISRSEKEKILDKIKKIESVIDVKKYITSISFYKEDDNSFGYDIEETDLCDTDDLKINTLLARWCLGKQILNYLEDNEQCVFYGEM